jgi:hypothetical protein
MATVIRSETHPDVASYGDVNRDVLKLLGKPGRSYFILLAVTMAVLAVGVSAWLLQVVMGIGMSGLINPVGWGVYITTFVFWVGIAHSGTLISAVLFLFRARWRQSIYRACRSHDGVRRHDGRPLPDHPPRPAVGLLLPAAVPEPAVPLAELQVAAALGRVRRLTYFTCPRRSSSSA